MTRDMLVVTFLSILELCKLSLIKITQGESLGVIWLTSTSSDSDLQAGEVDDPKSEELIVW